MFRRRIGRRNAEGNSKCHGTGIQRKRIEREREKRNECNMAAEASLSAWSSVQSPRFSGRPWDLHYFEEFLIVVDARGRKENIHGKKITSKLDIIFLLLSLFLLPSPTPKLMLFRAASIICSEKYLQILSRDFLDNFYFD